MAIEWQTYNPQGTHRFVVTSKLIGDRWARILTEADCRVEVCTSKDFLTKAELVRAMGSSCAGVIGQGREVWDKEVLEKLASAGGKIYCNYAVGYNNVDVASATSLGIPVGNTPGVLTGATAEIAVALTFAAARRIGEGDTMMRRGEFTGWKSTLLLGELVTRKTLGVIGVGRIGSAYAIMMVQGFRMDFLYVGRKANPILEETIAKFNRYLSEVGEKPVQCRRANTIEELLRQSDIVSLHVPLTDATRHLIDADMLSMMKKNAILVNTSRGAVVDEAALVEHCRKNPEFRIGLDVYEDEPAMKPGLKDLPNAVLSPHTGSATLWTREAMSVIAARNITGVLKGYPVWKGADVDVFLGENPPKAVPSIVNAKELQL